MPQLGNTNFYTENSENFVIEACEYKRSFLAYHPAITVITNIDLDHLDYYRDMDDYRDAFQSLVDQTREYVIVSASDTESQKLRISPEKKIIVGSHPDGTGYIAYSVMIEDIETGDVSYEPREIPIPALELLVPGEHLLHDAHLAYTVGKLRGLEDEVLVQRLQGYQGAWRRSEIIGLTQ